MLMGNHEKELLRFHAVEAYLLNNLSYRLFGSTTIFPEGYSQPMTQHGRGTNSDHFCEIRDTQKR